MPESKHHRYPHPETSCTDVRRVGTDFQPVILLFCASHATGSRPPSPKRLPLGPPSPSSASSDLLHPVSLFSPSQGSMSSLWLFLLQSSSPLGSPSPSSASSNPLHAVTLFPLLKALCLLCGYFSFNPLLRALRDSVMNLFSSPPRHRRTSAPLFISCPSCKSCLVLPSSRFSMCSLWPSLLQSLLCVSVTPCEPLLFIPTGIAERLLGPSLQIMSIL